MAKGRYIPKNPQKYVGNVNQIIFRSSWELTVLKFFDSSQSVLRYGSEEIAVPYISPKDGRVHKYYPDFICEYLDASANLQREIVEVKPLKETDIKYAKTPYDRECLAINEAKWKAASQFAAANGMSFRVITEATIYKQDPASRNKTRKTVKPKRATPTRRAAPKKK